ncbi:MULTISPECIES: TetR/AcrR family transcriptional regulator [Streptomyces]|uniref:TetR/AcrR family transcriptional regulator n=1 Tax=Streptomyces TaxID=1883 RepID=UPI0014082587|nr:MULTISPECIES: TetR/AcrR family transcriptional regulator [Streptomyces]MDH6224834.1 AcrR family transcriptional regulator [Streptomyces sp. MJP52]
MTRKYNGNCRKCNGCCNPPGGGYRRAGDGGGRTGLVDERRTGKWQAIVEGATRVFGQEGYARAGIDAIAQEAGVSTRTIYNHFPGGKAELFRTVLLEGSRRVVQAQVDAIDRRLHKVTDLEADLAAFARAWQEPKSLHPEHFAVVRQMQAEAGRLPSGFLETWRANGPDRSRAALAERFRELAEEGWFEAPDPEQAALHFLLLTGTEIGSRTHHGAVPLPEAEREALIAGGVRTFLYGHLPRGT